MPNPVNSRLTTTSIRQSKKNASRKLDEEMAKLEEELANMKPYKEDSYITKLKEEQSARVNFEGMTKEVVRPQTSNAEESQNQAKLERLKTEYNSLSTSRDKLAEAENTLNRFIKLINIAIDNKIKNKNPDPKNELELKVKETQLSIGNNFVGLGGNITSKNFSDTKQIEETLGTVSGRTSPLGKAEEYKKNVKTLSNEMNVLNDQLTVKSLTARSASDLLNMLEKTRDLRSRAVKGKIAIERDMRDAEVDIKYIKPENQAQKRPEQKGDAKNTRVNTR